MWVYPERGSVFSPEHDVPALRPFYFSFETNFHGAAGVSFSRRNYWLAPISTVLYLIFVWLGPRLMANRKPFDLRGPLKYWNLLLAIFSVFGLVRVAPHLFLYFWNTSFAATLCIPPTWGYGSGAVSFWLLSFIMSKVRRVGLGGCCFVFV